MKTIETYRKIKITYNEEKERFEAKGDNYRTREDSTLKGIREKIDRMLDEEARPRRQKPTPAIYLSEDWRDEENLIIKNVTITSFGRRGYYGNYRDSARVTGIDEYKKWGFVEYSALNNLFIDNLNNKKIVKEIKEIEQLKKEALASFKKQLNEKRKQLEKIKIPNRKTLPIWN